VKSCRKGCIRLRGYNNALQHLPASSILALNLIGGLILGCLRHNCEGNEKSQGKRAGEPEHRGLLKNQSDVITKSTEMLKSLSDYRGISVGRVPILRRFCEGWEAVDFLSMPKNLKLGYGTANR
jgi:hypothetical protein